MATSPQNQPSTVERLEEEYRRQEMLVEHVRALLVRADSRRDTEPENRRKWNRILDNLEAALAEARTKLEHCDMCLRREREWNQVVDGSRPADPPQSQQRPQPELDPLPQPSLTAGDAEAVAAELDGDIEAAEAARDLLETPMESVQTAPLEQVALAQRYLSLRKENGDVNRSDRRLAGRVELAIQGRTPLPPKPMVSHTIEERRHQKALREIVGKIQRNRLGSLTVQELELAVDCCVVLSQRIDLTQAEIRLRDLLLRGLHEADRLLHRLRERAGLEF